MPNKVPGHLKFRTSRSTGRRHDSGAGNPGGHTKTRTFNVKFKVVDFTSSYNAILDRSTFYVFQAVTSSLHQCLKFPIEGEMCTAKGSQKRRHKRATLTRGRRTRSPDQSWPRQPSHFTWRKGTSS